MYLGLQIGQEDLVTAFGRQPIKMSGMSEGWLFKYPDFYIKVYPIVHSLSYEIQYWAWGYEYPYNIDRVEARHLFTYATKLRHLFSNVPR